MPSPDSLIGRQPRNDKRTLEESDYRRLNPKCMISMYIGYAIPWAVLLVIYILIGSRLPEFLGLHYDTVRYAVLAILLITLIYIVAAPPVYYARYRYQITADKVDLRYGILVIRHILVPIERVHQVEVTRGPVDTLLGLGDVTITTAGGDATINYLEIEEAEKVADQLNNLIGRILQDQVHAVQTARPAPISE